MAGDCDDDQDRPSGACIPLDKTARPISPSCPKINRPATHARRTAMPLSRRARAARNANTAKNISSQDNKICPGHAKTKTRVCEGGPRNSKPGFAPRGPQPADLTFPSPPRPAHQRRTAKTASDRAGLRGHPGAKSQSVLTSSLPRRHTWSRTGGKPLI